MSVTSVAVRTFGRYTQKKRYEALQTNLRKARMAVSADAYVATAMLYAVFAGIGGVLLGLFISLLLNFSLLIMLAFILIFAGIFGFLSYQLMLYYPNVVINEHKRKIDNALPYAINFMYALSRSGATMADIFEELAVRTDIGEISKEAQFFVRNVKYLSQDPLTAARNLARTTPSDKFKNFLEVLISIIETGGEISTYFATKSIETQNTLKDDNKRTISTLEFTAEMYVILVAFTPLLFIAIILFMGLLPGQSASLSLLRLLAYVWIPFGTLFSAVFISTMSPERLGGKARGIRFPSRYKDVPVTASSPSDRQLIRRLKGTMWQARLRKFLANPLKFFVRNPGYVLVISTPIAAIYFLASATLTTTTAFLTFVIIFMPYTIAYEFRSKRTSQIDKALPGFLKSMSSASSSGLTLPHAISVAASADLGPLTDEIKRANKDIQWGNSADEALAKLEQRIGTSDTAARSIFLIRKASYTEENVGDVIDVVINDVNTQDTLRKERSTAIFVYKMIILMTFVVFLITSYFLVDSLLYSGITLPTGINITDVKLLFYHLLLLQALCVGFISAQMGERDLRGGLKYALVMMFVVWLIFEYVIIPKPLHPTVTSAEALLLF